MRSIRLAASNGDGPARLIVGEFFGRPVRSAEYPDGRRVMSVEDAINALGPETFNQSIVGKLEIGCVNVMATGPTGETVVFRAGDHEKIIEIVLNSNSPHLGRFKEFAAGVLGQVQRTGAYLPEEIRNDPVLSTLISMRLLQVESERRVSRLEAGQTALQVQVNAAVDFLALVGWCKKSGVPYSNKDGVAAEAGRRLSALARRLGVEIREVPDQHYFTVHSYPIPFLDEHAGRVLQGVMDDRADRQGRRRRRRWGD